MKNFDTLMNGKMDHTEDTWGYPITTRSRDECVAEIMGWVRGGERRKYFVCANPHSLEVARVDSLFEIAIKSADLVVPDGIGIVLASRMLGGSIRERVTGSDIFWGLCRMLNQEGCYSCFFLGSTKSNLARIESKMSVDFPNIRVVGAYSPPFRTELDDNDNQMMVNAINNANPDVLWVGMTAPKQEKLIFQNKDRLNVKFIGPIGAVFDFYAGTKKRSHPWFQEHGLEWLPRFVGEPKRLWKRNIVSSPLFLLHILKKRIFG